MNFHNPHFMDGNENESTGRLTPIVLPKKNVFPVDVGMGGMCIPEPGIDGLLVVANCSDCWDDHCPHHPNNRKEDDGLSPILNN